MRRIAVLILLATALTACGSSGGGQAVPTADQPSSTTSAPAGPSSTKAATTFSECMQNHGVEVAEPDPGKGLTGLDPALTETPAFKTALEACKDLLPGGVRGSTAPIDLTKYLAFSKCMRANGLPDFPDPKPGSKDGLFGGGAVDRNSPTFQKASKACSHPARSSRMTERKRRLLLVGGGAVLAAILIAVVVGVGGGGSAAETGSAAATPTAKVVKTDLVQSVHVSGTLSYGVPQPMTAPPSNGTITWIAPEGSAVKVGQPVYKIDNVPVILLKGTTPLYRPLSTGAKGIDVLEVEQNLATLGYFEQKPNTGYDAATTTAVKAWQLATGQPGTGTVDPHHVVMAQLGPPANLVGDGDLRIALHSLEVGDRVGSNANNEILTYSGTKPLVVVGLDVAKQYLVKKGLTATVTLPTGKSSAGTVASVSTVATVPEQGSDKPPNVPVVITLTDPAAAGGLDSAPVDVALVSAHKQGVLAVPVTALVALAEGGYGVQVVSDGKTSYVAVQTGMFADGKVEISGGGITDGTEVGVPS
ncbi:peptidoglycan-binding protein [Kribbella sp. NPDC026611]|uniref:peptidoglycan-binding protein n=1 Tax=Kribbella sp. NPDC026611 TaxID=3154911 RepID=UPI0033F25D38